MMRIRLSHLILILTLYLTLTITQLHAATPLIHPPDEAPFTPIQEIPTERTAYVAIHYEDYDTSQLSGHDSETSFQGIRTMMASVRDPRRGASLRDRVVLVPPHTPKDVRQTFEKDGLIVMEMDSSLPHKDICAPKFNRIYLWSRALAAKYDRVLYLDWDVIVQRPMDHLFLCGEFCMVYNSILHFVDGLMVVRPNAEVFDSMVDRYKRDRMTKWSRGGAAHADSFDDNDGTKVVTSESFDQASSSWSSPPKTFCWERSYLFFLEWFGNMEAAPLFKAQYGQSPLKLQRLDASAQLNAMMWYEKYSWTLMRGKEYRNMTDDQEVPALSLGFTTLKPFHWGPGIFFNLGWYWSDLRDEYLGMSDTWFAVSRIILWIGFLLFATKGLRKLMIELYRTRSGSGNTNHSSITGRIVAAIRSVHLALFGPTDGWTRKDGTEEWTFVPTTAWSLTGYWLPLYGSDILGIIFGSIIFFGIAYFMSAYTLLIPILTGPHWAWRIWLMFHVVGVYACNHWIFLSYYACPPLMNPSSKSETGRSSPSSSPSSSPQPPAPASNTVSYPLVASVAWLGGWEAILYWFMRRTFYPEFVVKMFVLFPLLAAMLITAINMNRAVWRSIEKSNGFGAKDPIQAQLLPTSANYRNAL